MPAITVNVPLRWADVDSFGHVNNVMYLRLLEEARLVAFNRPMPGGGTLMDTGVLIARSEIDYLHQLLYRPEPLRCRMWTTHIGATSFDLQYAMLDGEECESPVEYAHAETTIVVFDLETGRPRRLREAEVTLLSSWLEDPVEMRGQKARKRRERIAAKAAAAQQ